MKAGDWLRANPDGNRYGRRRRRKRGGVHTHAVPMEITQWRKHSNSSSEELPSERAYLFDLNLLLNAGVYVWARVPSVRCREGRWVGRKSSFKGSWRETILINRKGRGNGEAKMGGPRAENPGTRYFHQLVSHHLAGSAQHGQMWWLRALYCLQNVYIFEIHSPAHARPPPTHAPSI